MSMQSLMIGVMNVSEEHIDLKEELREAWANINEAIMDVAFVMIALRESAESTGDKTLVMLANLISRMLSQVNPKLRKACDRIDTVIEELEKRVAVVEPKRTEGSVKKKGGGK